MPRKNAPRDPLDALMGILAVSAGGVGAACYFGFAYITLPATAALIGVAYLTAPARKYPTAQQIAESSKEGGSLKNKTVIVTGGTGGIGLETARVLALQGAHVYIAARNATKIEETIDSFKSSLPDTARISPLVCDLNDLQSVKDAASQFLQKEKELNILINNAGIMALPERRDTAQGLEQQVGVCHVGHFYLTKLLLPALELGAATSKETSRVVCLSSMGFYNHDFAVCLEDAKLETVPYDKWTAYGNAKTCNMMHARELHKRNFASKNVTAFSLNPGGIYTGLQTYVEPWRRFKWAVVAPFFFKTVPQGASTTMYAALEANPEKDGGQYLDNTKVTEIVSAVENEVGSDTSQRCWDVTEKLLSSLGFA